jgi:hypothetical protein
MSHDPITLVNPADPTQIWVSGKRGKRPTFVTEMLKANPNLLPSKEKNEAYVPPADDNTPRLRYWRWNGLNDEDGKGIPLTYCIVGAMTPHEAMKRLNKTFNTPVMPSEWGACWREVNPENVQLGGRMGVFEQNKISKEWEERKEKTFGSKA